MRILPFVFILFYSQKAFSLAVGKKFKVGLVKHSKSKRTILLNRGKEDGIALKDHAKLSDRKGKLVVRIVASKISPTRSIWTVYKLLDKKRLEQGAIYQMEITKPVELTSDPSKGVERGVNNALSGETDRIPIAKTISTYGQRRVLPFKPEGDFSILNDFVPPLNRPPEDFSGISEEELVKKVPDSLFPTLNEKVPDEKVLKKMHTLSEKKYKRLIESGNLTYWEKRTIEKVANEEFSNLSDY